MNKMGRANFYKICAGTVMVEFAVILPLLLLILFGITELGRALYQQNILTQAVESGGRYMARVPGAVNEDCSMGGVWVDAEAQAKALIKENAAPIIPTVTVDDPVPRDLLPVLPTCVITVNAQAEFQGIFGENLISVPGYQLGSVTLNAATQHRYIGH